MLLQLEINGIAHSNDEQNSLVLLKEKNGQRMFPVMTSRRRAMLLLARAGLHATLPAPPSVADICKQMMSHFDVNIRYVRLTTIHDGKCFCSVVGEHGGEDHVVNYCQASDGLIIAVTFNCPIVIDDALMDLQYMRSVGDSGFSMNINTLSRNMLSDALQHAIDIEDYETASALRDELRRRENDDDPKFRATLSSLLSTDGNDTTSDSQ